MEKNILEKLKNIKAFFFDVDGVFTNGDVIATESEEFFRVFNIKDGYAVQHAVKQKLHIVIISGATSKGVVNRMKLLGINEIHVGIKNKLEVYENLKTKYQLQDKDIAYMGDDMPDIPVLKKVGLSCCPQDAASDVLEIADFISSKNGGEGCVRDLLEKAMKLKNCWYNEEGFIW